MTDMTTPFLSAHSNYHTGPAAQKRLRRRHAREARFKAYGRAAIAVALAALGWLLVSVVGSGLSAFRQYHIDIEVFLDPAVADPSGGRDPVEIRRQDYSPLLFDAVFKRIPGTEDIYERIDRLTTINEKHAEEMRTVAERKGGARDVLADNLLGLVNRDAAAGALRNMVLDDTGLIGRTREVGLPASAALAAYAVSGGGAARLSPAQRAVADGLIAQGRIKAAPDGGASVAVDIEFAQYIIDPRGREREDDIAEADFGRVIARSLAPFDSDVLARFSELEDGAIRAGRDREASLDAVRKLRRDRINVRDEILGILSESGAGNLVRRMVTRDPSLIGSTVKITVPASDHVDQYLKGHIKTDLPQERRSISDRQIRWIDRLAEAGNIHAEFNACFFICRNSKDPELAGLGTAIVGTFLTLIITFILSFPIGVAAAVYLEEFAPRNRWTDLIEVNINNLAAVPSIVFGLLGLAMFINYLGLPRSAPLVGGMVLALMTMPTIIIASRAALKAVPPSIREGALGIGASPVQTVFHHVLPLAMPGILTGSIIGMAQALGETAPLLMIGMVAFVTEIPSGFSDPATALPVQIFNWASESERAFVERTSGAIVVLLAVLFLVNIIAILLRRRFERRW